MARKRKTGSRPAGAAAAVADPEPARASDDVARDHRGVRLLVVANGHTLLWPVKGAHVVRGGEGTVVPEDDPLLHTESIPEPQRRALQLLDSDQRFKCAPAPAGSGATPHASRGAQAVYAALQYEGVPYIHHPTPQELQPERVSSSGVRGSQAHKVGRQRTEVVVPRPID